MCGIAGFWQPNGGTNEALAALAKEMADTLAHRGPDDSGVWVGAGNGVALGFRRLSILDVSEAGHQPMLSQSGRYRITFNGEVYNFGEMRRELEAGGASFRGNSDTEVILAAIEAWGLPSAVARFVGMFAFALWDREERTLSLVRDRLGIKPLYYGWMDGTLLWGSEVKALRAHPAFRGEIDRGALSLYLRHNYVPAPYSIYQNVCKLTPGSILTIDSPGRAEVFKAPEVYWSANEVVENGALNLLEGGDQEAVEQLDCLLREAVRLRMISDVPLGAFLSGGVDSSTVVAIMQCQSSRPVKTFSIGFREEEYNEAAHARAVAAHLGTDHYELYVTPEEARNVIPQLPAMYDEPFADVSQIPTYLVSLLARQHVAVALSGDGGDELFAGYSRYLTVRSIWNKIGWIPAGLRQGLASYLARVLPGERGKLWADLLGTRDAEALYHRVHSHWKAPSGVVIGGCEPPTALTALNEHPGFRELMRHMMLADLIGYLPGDILAKVDRASMAVSLEARVPLLDHRVVEFVARLPLSMKVRGGKGKWILRQVLDGYVPRKLIERPKMGFGVPVGLWLRGPLRDWAEALLGEKQLRDGGFFRPAPIRKKWAEHLSGQRDWQYYLWDVLMFQAWLAAGPRFSRDLCAVSTAS